MNIALFIERFDPAAGGVERSTAQIAERLVRRGHAVTIVTAGAPATDLLPGVRIQRMADRRPTRLWRMGLWLLWSRWILRRGGFDVSMSVTTTVAADVLQPRAGTLPGREAGHLRAMSAEPRWRRGFLSALHPKHGLLRMIEPRVLAGRRVWRVLVPTPRMYRELIDRRGVPAERVTVLPNAAAAGRLDAETRSGHRRAIRALYGIDAAATVFLFAARAARLKGVMALVAAAARLAEVDARPFHVLAAGEPPVEAVRRAHRAGLADRFHWLGPTGRMDALYAAADATVIPTGYDPANKVVIESLLHGLPTISTQHDGAADWIVEPACGRAAETPPPVGAHPAGHVIAGPEAVEALSGAMADLLDPARRRACTAATAGLDPRLQMDHHVDQLETLFHVLANG